MDKAQAQACAASSKVTASAEPLGADSADTGMRCQPNSSMLAQFIKSEGTEVDWGVCGGEKIPF